MMIILLLMKMIACSGILFGYYWLFLRNKRFHYYNRYFLLGATALSMVLPFLKIPVFMETDSSARFMYQSISVISVNKWEHEFVENTGADQSVNWLDIRTIALIIYILVVATLFFLFLRSLRYIQTLSKRYPVEHIQKLKFYNTTEPGTPFSFFKSIFWNMRVDFHSHEGQQIFRHELFHVRQKHSADIIFLEVIRVLLWVNPFFYLIKKEIKAIHEFLADQYAISNTNHHDYAELLLLQSITEKKSTLSNYFFQNHIKRRIAMITQMNSNRYGYWTRLMVLPVSLFLFCAIALYAQTPGKGWSKSNNFNYAHESMLQQITVLIDAGHGGEDAGARNADGLLEKNLALAIARKISEQAATYKIKVVMTRDQDVYPTLKERSEMATAIKADMIISIHIGSTGSEVNEKPANGFDVYVTNRNQRTMEQSKLLGQNIVAQLKDLYTVGAIKQRKENGIWILDAVSCPAVIIECGYMSDPKDIAFISDPQNQEQVAKRILEGIVRYKSIEKTKALVDTIPGEKIATGTLKPDHDDAEVKPGNATEESKLAKKPAENEKKMKQQIQKQKEYQLAQKKLIEDRHERLKKHQNMQVQKQQQLEIAQEKMESARITEQQKLQKKQVEKQLKLQLAQNNVHKKQLEIEKIEGDKFKKNRELTLKQNKIQKKQLELQNHQQRYQKKQQEISLMHRKMVERGVAEMNRLEREPLKREQEVGLYQRKNAEVRREKMKIKDVKKPAKPSNPKQSKPPLPPQPSQKPPPFIEQF